MIQPVIRSVKTLVKAVIIRQYSSNNIQKKSEILYAFNRKYHHATEKNVVTSNYPDIVIPNCTISDFIWKDLEKWADKTAVVSSLLILYSISNIIKLQFFY